MQSPSSQLEPVKKHEDDEKLEKREVRALPKTLNRVPRKPSASKFACFFLIPRVSKVHA